MLTSSFPVFSIFIHNLYYISSIFSILLYAQFNSSFSDKSLMLSLDVGAISFINGSKVSKQSYIISSVSQYTSTVIISDACPYVLDTAFASKFAFNNIVPYVCLKS